MNEADRYQHVMMIFQAAIERAPDDRDRYLESACAGDDSLRAEVDSLLANDRDEAGALAEEQLGIGSELLQRAIASPAQSTDEDSIPSHLPERVGRYRILHKIGEGGMGSVYQAEQESPRRTVAVKVLRPGAISERSLRRFQHESDVLGQLQHPGIAQILEADMHDDGHGLMPFFAMQFIDGRPITSFAEEQHLPNRARLELMAKVCDAVQYAHESGVIHRDLKPANILVDVSGQPKVLDFGVARSTDQDTQLTTLRTNVGELIGTIPYMSPEQFAGDPTALDTRSDVYAMGVVLFELLTNRLPHDLERRTIPEAARILQEGEPKRLSSIDVVFRGDIDTIVAKAIEKDPSRRYQSAAQLADDIRRYLRDEPIIARPVSTLYRMHKFTKRNKALVGGIATTIIALLIGVVSSTIFAVESNENARRAQQGEANARWKAYRASIAAASAARAAHDPQRSARHLDEAPEEFRNWEHAYLRAQLDPVLANLEFDEVQDANSSRDTDVAFQSDGTAVAAWIFDGSIQLIDMETTETLGTFGAGLSLVLSTLNENGARLAAYSRLRQNITVWDVDSRELLHEVAIDELSPVYLGLSHDGSLIAASDDQIVAVFDTQTGQRHIWHELREDLRVGGGSFSTDGIRFALCAFAAVHPSSGVIYIFDTNSGDLLVNQSIDDLGRGLALSPDGHTLAIGSSSQNRTIRILDAATLETTRILRGHSSTIRAIAFSSNGQFMASASPSALRIWDTKRWETILIHPMGLPNVTSMTIRPDGSYIISTDGNRAELMHLQTDPAMVLRGHQTYVYLTTFHPDGSIIASSDFDRETRLWSALTGEQLAVLPGASRFGIAFNRDGSQLVRLPPGPGMLVGSFDEWDETAKLHDESQYFHTARGGSKRHGPLPGEGKASSLDGTLLAIAQSSEVLVRDLKSEVEMARVGIKGGGIHAVAISPDNSVIAAGGSDHLVHVWELETGMLLAEMSGHTSTIYSVNFNPGGSRIVSAGNDNTIILWDVKTFESVLELHGHSSYVHSVAFSPDGSQIVSGSGDGTVRIWDSVPRRTRRAHLKIENETRTIAR